MLSSDTQHLCHQITRGLLQKYGPDRVKDTPITEVCCGVFLIMKDELPAQDDVDGIMLAPALCRPPASPCRPVSPASQLVQHLPA